MRSLIALALTTAPALAHPGHGPHMHEARGFWIAAAAFTIGLGLTVYGMRKTAKVRP